MIDSSPFPVLDEMVVHLKALIQALNEMGRERLDLDMQRRNGLPYDAQRFNQLNMDIDTSVVELQKTVLVASEHFSNKELAMLRKQIGMNIFQWCACRNIGLPDKDDP